MNNITPLANGATVGFQSPLSNTLAVIKTHMHCKDYFRLGLQEKVVNVVRDGRDVMISYYFYTQSRIWNREAAEIRFDEREFLQFLQQHLKEWMFHVASWLHCPSGMSVLTMTYEELKADYPGSLARIIKFVDRTPALSIRECHTRFVTKQVFGQSPDAFFRKGIIGDWKNHFTRPHKEYFKAVAGQMLINLGYANDGSW